MSYDCSTPYTSDTFFAMYPNFAAQIGSPPSPIIPLAVVDAFVALAVANLDCSLWQDSYPVGIGLYIAHYVSMWLSSSGTPATTAQQASTQGMSSGVLSSKAVGDVSASYDTTVGVIDGAGAWNLTKYGRLFYMMAQIIGAGGRQLMPPPIEVAQGTYPFPLIIGF